MKKSLVLLSALFILFTSVAGQPAKTPIAVSENVNSFQRLKELFADPPAEFRPAPLWVWNGQMTEVVIDQQLKELKEQGMGGVFIHPRPGLITPYLSKQWFDLCRHTLLQGMKLGLKVWLYDENSYPSGFAGGHVPAEMPESYDQGQSMILVRQTVLKPEELDAPCIVILKKENNALTDITHRVAQERGKSGEYLLFKKTFYQKSPWYGGFPYVDLLYPGVTEKFIELTMRGYEQAMGDEFGKTVPGIFTDEPGIQTRRNEVRWTPDLFDRFLVRWGYDLRLHLLALFEDQGDWQRVRHNYFQLLLELFIDRWAKPYYQYCQQHRMALTGHYWEHEWPNPYIGPDNMAMYIWHHVPSIDLLFNQFRDDTHAQFGNVRSVKELASVANQTGRKRTLSENYGGAGWELRFNDMKRLGDWSYVLGVNFTNPHLSYQTMIGARKYDYPQSFSYHEPWWKHFHLVADYFGRLSLALSSGVQANRILVLEPTTSAWMYASAQRSSERLKEIGDLFQNFVNRLESQQVEYDLGSENILGTMARVEENRFMVGQASYQLVVLPPGLENLNVSTVILLEAFLSQGGKVLSFVEPPPYMDGFSSSRLKMVASLFPSQWLRATDLTDRSIQGLLTESDFQVKPRGNSFSGRVFHHRRRLQDGQLLFLVNSSLEESSALQVRTKSRSAVCLDPASGKTIPMAGEQADDDSIFQVELPPAGSLLIYLDPKETTTPIPAPPNRNWKEVAAAGPLQIRRLQPNAIKLDYCDLRLGERTETDLYAPSASEKVFKHFGFTAGNPWNTAVQFRTSILDRNQFPADSGFEADFAFLADSALKPVSIQAVVERPELWKVTVNRKPVHPKPGQWFLDRAFGVYDIGSAVIPGKNIITLKAQPMSIHNELEPVLLLGDFGVIPQPKGWKLVPPSKPTLGSWKDQQMPFYGYAVSYSAEFPLSSPPSSYQVKIGKWDGTLAEVLINGKSAGLIGWAPYTVDVTPFIKEKNQKVEVVVYGSLKNLLGPHHQKPQPGLVAPGRFLAAPDSQPEGGAYDLLPYGLYEAFQFLQSPD